MTNRLPPDPPPAGAPSGSDIPFTFSQDFSSPAQQEQFFATMNAYLRDPRFEFVMIVRPIDAPAPILTFNRLGPNSVKGHRGIMLFLQQAGMVFQAMFAKYLDEPR